MQHTEAARDRRTAAAKQRRADARVDAETGGLSDLLDVSAPVRPDDLPDDAGSLADLV